MPFASDPAPSSPVARTGFTLLELLVCLAIGAALLVLATSSYRAWIEDLEMRDRVEALVGAMSFARAEAIKHDSRVQICPSAGGSQCDPGGRWEAGWILFADHNGDGQRDVDEPLLRVYAPGPAAITVRGNRPVTDYVSYTGLGHTRMLSGALQMGTFTICRPGSRAIDVVLANGGRVRVNRTTAACP